MSGTPTVPGSTTTGAVEQPLRPRAEPAGGGSPPPPAPPQDLSLGGLVGRMTSDLSTLFRQEVELAKVELKEEATKAAKGAGMMGATAFAAYMAVLFLSFGAAWGLAEAMAVPWAFVIMGALYAIGGAVVFSAARRQVKAVQGPKKTMQTLKEDVKWAHDRMS